MPVYGDGLNVRDWIHVSDHCRAIRPGALPGAGRGEVYNIGGNSERTNLQITHLLLAAAGRGTRADPATSRTGPGHDRRYAIDSTQDHDASWAGGRR